MSSYACPLSIAPHHAAHAPRTLLSSPQGRFYFGRQAFVMSPRRVSFFSFLPFLPKSS
jgi:hypothetical protein